MTKSTENNISSYLTNLSAKLKNDKALDTTLFEVLESHIIFSEEKRNAVDNTIQAINSLVEKRLNEPEPQKI